ncbi:MAG TPA: sugar phosphate nucleotidyltransferase [Candidatus Pacearchaeota archaeon]|nr:sugar phosphate nucleotidyltransferase [Candidatus Pacearchaeota archaeon]
MENIKTAIVPVAGLSTRFLPLSKVVPKEFWPLVDKPVIQYIIEEIKNSGIEQIIFILSPKNKKIIDYIKPSLQLEKLLKERKKDDSLKELKELEKLFESISFSFVVQKKALGDGHAVLQAANLIGDESFACLFADDIVESETPCISQLIKIFKTCQKPVLSLYRLPKEKISSYGVVSMEKIANRLFKIKEIIEKPKIEQTPSDLAIVGKYILTPEIFDYLRKIKPNEKGEIILANALNLMLKEGKIVYGYEFEGKWLECGNKIEWLKSHLYLSLNHPQYGSELRKFLKEIN